MANNGIVRVSISTHGYLSNMTWYRSDFGIKLKLMTSSCALYVIQVGGITPYPRQGSHENSFLLFAVFLRNQKFSLFAVFHFGTISRKTWAIY